MQKLFYVILWIVGLDTFFTRLRAVGRFVILFGIVSQFFILLRDTN